MLNPYVIFSYFAGLFAFMFMFKHPLFVLVIFMATVFYALFYNGFKNSKKTFKMAFFVGVTAFFLNPVLVHRGRHVLFYLFGNSVTAEAFVYGFCFGLLISTVIIAFISFNLLMDGSRLLFVFYKMTPSTVFVVILSLRSFSRFLSRAEELIQVQSLKGISLTKGKIVDRIKNCGLLMSALMTWNLEEGLKTAETLKSKDYGKAKRSFYNTYKFTLIDCVYLLVIIFTAVLLIIFFLNGSGNCDIYANLNICFDVMDLPCLFVLICYLFIPLSLENLKRI